jgi:hypothetical protein
MLGHFFWLLHKFIRYNNNLGDELYLYQTNYLVTKTLAETPTT